MLKRRVFSLVCILALICVGSLPVSADGPAVGEIETVNISDLEYKRIESTDKLSFSARAYGSFDWTISAGKIRQDSEGFSLEAYEVVTINCTYSPMNASLAIGLIAPDGLFHYIDTTGGSFRKSIEVNERGKYYMAIENTFNNTVTVMGFVYY